MKTTILTILMSTFLLTGCFGPSDEDSITSKIGKKFELINKSDITLLFSDNNSVETNIQNISSFTKCLVRSNPKVKDSLVELDKKNKIISEEMLQLNSVLDSSITKKLDKDLGEAEGNLEEFQKLLISFKNKLSEKNVNKEILEIMFDGETLKASTQRGYMTGIMLNVAVDRVLKPLNATYSSESSICVQDVTGLIPLRGINKISIIEDSATATLVFDNNETSVINLEKEDKEWKFK